MEIQSTSEWNNIRPHQKMFIPSYKTKSSSSKTSIETWSYINYWLFVIQKKVQNWALLLLVLLLVAVGDGKYNKNSVFDLEYWTSDFMFYIKIFQMKILALWRWRRFQQKFHLSSIQANIAAINFLERPHKSESPRSKHLEIGQKFPERWIWSWFVIGRLVTMVVIGFGGGVGWVSSTIHQTANPTN